MSGTRLLVGPVGYHSLTDDDVFGLFDTLAKSVSIPVIVYDNPGGTPFSFSDELYARVASLPGVESIKTPGLPTDPADARARISQLRGILPGPVTIGMSGDANAATGLIAGADMWCSVIGGILPTPALTITRLAQEGDADGAHAESERLKPLWDLIVKHQGGYRVVAAIAELAGLTAAGSLPLPIRGLQGDDRAEVARVLSALELWPADSRITVA